MKAPTIRQFRESFGTWLPVDGKWEGDAYGYHPHGVIFRPMIYTDHHNISGSCDAKVMTVPSAAFKPRAQGREASLGNSGLSPNPQPETGELVTVYANGEWVGPDGPWRAQLRRDMAAVIRDIRRIKKAQRDKDVLAQREQEVLSRERFERAKQAFAHG